MTDRLTPSETTQIWKALEEMWESGLLRPTVYEQEYIGLDSVKRAMKDLQARKVWGKAVIRLDSEWERSTL
jgi:NADPH2:quinone reductase